MIAKLIRKSNQHIVSLEDAKAHLRITHSHEDFYINSLLDVVTTTLESELERDLVNTDYIFQIHEKLTINEPILFPNSPVFNVEVEVLNGNEELVDFSYSTSDEYIAFSELPENYTTVKIKYKKGFEDVVDLPSDIVHAAKLLLTDFYQFRGTIVVGKTIIHLQKTIDRLLAPYRKASFL